MNNQTNLAIKGIIAIEAMSKMSSVVKQTKDTNKYSVCFGPLFAVQYIYLPVECSCETLRTMEERWIGRRPASPCSVWAGGLVDFGVQSIRGCVVGH